MISLANSLNLIWVQLWMTFLPRNERESVKLFWVFMEPAGQLVIMMMIFNLIGRTAGYGLSFALFMMTGLVMMNMFNTGSRQVMAAVLQMEGKARLAQIGLFHGAVAAMIFQVIVAIGYTSVLTWAIGLYEGVDTRPYHIEMCALAFAVAGALAFGVGLLRVLMATFLPALHKVYSILTRAMIFISGIFFVPSFMPPHLREWLWLNPVLHNVELLRLGYYDQYPTTMMSPTYLAAWILIPTAFGMVGLWVNRRIYLS